MFESLALLIYDHLGCPFSPGIRCLTLVRLQEEAELSPCPRAGVPTEGESVLFW